MAIGYVLAGLAALGAGQGYMAGQEKERRQRDDIRRQKQFAPYAPYFGEIPQVGTRDRSTGPSTIQGLMQGLQMGSNLYAADAMSGGNLFGGGAASGAPVGGGGGPIGSPPGTPPTVLDQYGNPMYTPMRPSRNPFNYYT